jgi:stage V sporulation protein R
VPDVQIVSYDKDGDRSLTLRHTQRRGRRLNDAAAEVVLHLRRLWGFPVRLERGKTTNPCIPLNQ